MIGDASQVANNIANISNATAAVASATANSISAVKAAKSGAAQPEATETAAPTTTKESAGFLMNMSRSTKIALGAAAALLLVGGIILIRR